MKLKTLLEGQQSGTTIGGNQPNAEKNPFYGEYIRAVIRARRNKWKKRKKTVEK